MNCRGTAPPTTLSTNSNPVPRGSGSTVMSQTAYCPWPPDCLTCRPCPVAWATKVSRSGTLTSSVSTVTPNRSTSPASTVSTCAWPIVHSTTWWVSWLCSSRSVGSSAVSRCRAPPSLSSSDLVLGCSATGSSGSGSTQGSISTGVSLALSVSDV